MQEGRPSGQAARAAAQGELHVRVELAAAAASGQRALAQPGHHAQLTRRAAENPEGCQSRGVSLPRLRLGSVRSVSLGITRS